MKLRVRPTTLTEANAFVAAHHRHHKPVAGQRFSIGAWDSDRLVGVVIIGRPVARRTDSRSVAEVTRLCTDGTYNACSILYAAAARAAQAMGFDKIQTFILDSEHGTSLKASGWVCSGASGGGTWSRPSRGRVDQEKALPPKTKWVRVLRAEALNGK